MLKNEIKRALSNKGMMLSLAVGHGISLMHWVEIYVRYFNRRKNMGDLLNDPSIYIYQIKDTPFCGWMLGRVATREYVMFIYLLPILAALPFAATYWKERKSGYYKNVLTRSSGRRYRLCKYAATYLSAAISVGSVLVTNLMMCFAAAEYRTPTPAASARVTWPFTLFGCFFYDHPFIYCFAYILLVAVVAGTIATVSLLISKLSDNFFSIMLLPFFVYTMLGAFATDEEQVQYLPVTVLSATNSGKNFIFMLVCCIVVMAVTFVGFVVLDRERIS